MNPSRSNRAKVRIDAVLNCIEATYRLVEQTESRTLSGGLVREIRKIIQTCALLAAGLCAPTPIFAQDAASGEEQPEPNPGGLDIQAPRPRLLAIISLGAPNEYRDRQLSDRNVVSVSAGVAYEGFSASGWLSKELSTERAASEFLVGYSYKLPLVDLHAALVTCSNDRMLGGCADGVRLTVTTNSISRTTIEGSIDLALASDRRGFSASINRDLWQTDQTSGAVRVGWTRTAYGQSMNLDGFSLRMIAERRLGSGLALSFAAGAAWTSGRAQPASARDGPFATTSLVWRY